LFPAKIVDGFESKQGCAVFEYRVESPEQLSGKSSEYYVVLSIETKKGKDTVTGILKNTVILKMIIYLPMRRHLNERNVHYYERSKSQYHYTNV
jgi:hypothetical protein